MISEYYCTPYSWNMGMYLSKAKLFKNYSIFGPFYVLLAFYFSFDLYFPELLCTLAFGGLDNTGGVCRVFCDKN